MKSNISTIWHSVLDDIGRSISKPSFETWLKTTKPLEIHENTLVVEVPNEFTKEWLQNHYHQAISSSLQKVCNHHYHVHFVTAQSIVNPDASSTVDFKNKRLGNVKSPPSSPSPSAKNDSSVQSVSKNLSSVCKWLNPKYTFESFVVGGSNRLAHAASLAVAEAPSRAYNPLFIYGGVGLGKTHLMHAIGHFVITNITTNNVAYLSSEKFTNQFINSIRDNKTVEFREKYRNIDVLLIDDIQFLAGKEQTQEEFFHTFNALHENNKQIVISSDRPPKEIPTLEDRLRSRFEWGLITDIHSPDLETRIAILRKKNTHDGIFIPDEIITFIAQKIEKNIRELEGALIRIIAYASLEDKQVTLHLAEDALKDFLSSNKKLSLSLDQIITTTASYFKVTPDDIKSKKRTHNVSAPRQIAMYLCRELTEYSLPKIGEAFGGKDHTTVIHAHRKVNSSLHSDDFLQRSVKEIKNRIFEY